MKNLRTGISMNQKDQPAGPFTSGVPLVRMLLIENGIPFPPCLLFVAAVLFVQEKTKIVIHNSACG